MDHFNRIWRQLNNITSKVENWNIPTLITTHYNDTEA